MKQEKAYLSAVAALGCIICGAPAEIHHPRFAVGMSQRASHWLAIGLCSTHHRIGQYGEAIHQGQALFERNHGSEESLLAETIRRMFAGRK
jgi:hypothetical protein